MVTTRSQNKFKDPLQVVIFDLDGTLHDMKKMKLEDNVVDMLEYLRSRGKKIVLASLNANANLILEHYKIYHYFDKIYYKNWHIGGKDKMEFFKKINEIYGIPYEHMVLFDDNEYHCREAYSRGIKYIIVDDTKLITWNDLIGGLEMFRLNFD